MKIFGKEINLNSKRNVIVIALTLFMVVIIGTVSLIAAITVAAKSVTLKTNGHEVYIVYGDNADLYEFIQDAPEEDIKLSDDKTYNLFDKSEGSVTLKPKETETFDYKFSFSIYTSERNLKAKMSNSRGSEIVITPTIVEDEGDYYTASIKPLMKNKNDEKITIEFFVEYNVDVTASAGIELVTTSETNDKKELVEGANSVEENKGGILTAKVNAGYILNAKGANVSDPIPDDDNLKWIYTVTVETVTSNMSLELTASPKPITVEVTGFNQEGFTQTYTTGDFKKWNKFYGESFSIRLVPKDGYEYPMVKYAKSTEFDVSKNGTELSQVNGTYTIDELTEDIKIVIEKPVLKTYSVSWTTPDGVKEINATYGDNSIKIANGGTVDYNTEVTFEVDKDTAYTNSPLTFTANGKTVPVDAEGKYKVTVTDNTIIAVTGLKKNTYAITFNHSDNVDNSANGPHYAIDLDTTASVEHGGKLTFSVVPNDGYGVPTVAVNEDVEGSSNKEYTVIKTGTTYTVNNITSNVKVTVTDGAVNRYTLTANNPDGAQVEFYIADSSEADKTKSVEHGKKVTVKVKLSDGYEWSNQSITINGSPVVVNLSNDIYEYVIDKATENITVVVSGVSKKVYNVTLPSSLIPYAINGATQQVVDGNACTFSLQLPKGMTLNTSTDGFVNTAYAYVANGNDRVSGNNNNDIVVFNTSTGIVTVTCTNVKNNGEVKFVSDSTSISSIVVNPFRQITLQPLYVDYANAKYSIDNIEIVGNNANITVSSKPGYKITSAYYSVENAMGWDPAPIAADLPQTKTLITLTSLGSGKHSASINIAYSDLYIYAEAEPISVNVTYMTTPIVLGNATLPATEPVTKRYVLGEEDDESTSFFAPVVYPFMPIVGTTPLKESNGIVTLDLDTNLFAGGMYEANKNGGQVYFDKTITVSGSGINTTLFTNSASFIIPAEYAYQDLNLTVTANYTLSTALSTNKIPFITITNQSTSPSLVGDQVKFSWTATLNYDAGISESLKAALIKAQYTVDGYGFALFKTTAGRNTQQAGFVNWIASQTFDNRDQDNSSKDGFHLYRYYSNGSKQIGSNNGWFNYWTTADPNKMSGDGNPTGSPSRCGIFYFNVNIAGKTYAFIQDAQELTYSGVGVPSASLPAGIYPSMLG